MRDKNTNKATEILKLFFVIALLLIVIRLFIAQNYTVSDSDMENTFHIGDVVLVNMLAYSYSSIRPGDLILINHPFIMGGKAIRRVVAIGGQMVEIRDKELYVDSVLVQYTTGTKYVDEMIYPEEFSFRDNFGPVEVPSGKAFVMADNRDISIDSRIWSSLELKDIIGKSSVIVFSWKEDPNAPKFESPYITPLFRIFFYNLFHFFDRVDWGRIGITLERV